MQLNAGKRGEQKPPRQGLHRLLHKYITSRENAYISPILTLKRLKTGTVHLIYKGIPTF